MAQSATYRPIDSKREEFRKYLERTGVMDALTKCLVCLYEEPEKPEDALSFVRQHLGGGGVEGGDAESLKKELDETKRQLEALQEENNQLKERLIEVGGDTGGIAAEPVAEAPPEEEAPPPEETAEEPPAEAAPEEEAPPPEEEEAPKE